ncbi:MAG: choice-of-anchor Q domain-containing protein, partial [Candidatus Syntrophosphaera sp.]
LMTIAGFECDNLLINNFISANNTLTDWERNTMGMYFSSCDLVLRNSIIANNTAQDAWPFFYTNIYPGFEEFNLDMSNVLIINNTISNLGWVSNPIYMQNRSQPMQINNCTFANNNTNATLTSIIGGADIRNLVSYNPGTPYELYLMNYISNNGMSYNASVSNSLFRTDTVGSSLPDLVTFTDNIMGSDPVFLGSVDTSYGIDQPEYYHLSSGSPCINTGTADTTGLNLPPMDLAGNYRVWDGRIDMGWYEYGSVPYVSVDDPELPAPPEGFRVSVYPNPLLNTNKAAGVFIEFTLPKEPMVQPVVEIFNIRGQKVKTIRLRESYNSLIRKAGLSGDVKQNGEFYSTVWNGRDDNNRPLASGTYVVKVMADQMAATTKITLIK